MKYRLRSRVEEWLEREAESAEFVREAEREIAAEDALRRVFRRMPFDRPSAGFADRVLVQAGVAALRSGEGLPAWMPLGLFRGVVLALVLVVGTLLLLLPSALMVFGPDWSLSAAIGQVVSFLQATTHSAARALGAFETLFGAGSTVAGILVHPTWGWFLALSLTVSAAATRALHGLIVPTRSV